MLQKKSTYRYVGFFAGVSLLFFLIILQNNSILYATVFSDGIETSFKFQIVMSVFIGYFIEISVQSVLSLLIAILFGINTALILYYWRLNRANANSVMAALSSGSVMSALVGIGCLSCGSLLTAFIASIFGASSLLILFPFGGIEFSILSVLLLVISITILYRKL